jgi:hypothetical protein
MAEMRILLGLPRSFRGEELIWYRGLTVLGHKVLPVAEPRGFLTALELQRLEDENPGLLLASRHPVGTSRHERERV